MKIPEKINQYRIIALYYLKLKFSFDRNNMNCLIYCNNMGIGNFVNYLPTLTFLNSRFKCYIITESKEINYLSELFLGIRTFKTAPDVPYNYVYCNFLNMTKKNILEIVRFNIPYRHCIVMNGYDKWNMLFNIRRHAKKTMSEVQINALFGSDSMEIVNDTKKGDYIVIQPNSLNDTGKNYPLIKKLINQLAIDNYIYLVGTDKELFEFQPTKGDPSFERTIELIKGAKLYIGNDSGLSHIAWLYSTPSIIIWQKAENIDRCMHVCPWVINLYRPHFKNLIKIINNEIR